MILIESWHSHIGAFIITVDNIKLVIEKPRLEDI
jgi:hypothetical protein